MFISLFSVTCLFLATGFPVCLVFIPSSCFINSSPITANYTCLLADFASGKYLNCMQDCRMSLESQSLQKSITEISAAPGMGEKGVVLAEVPLRC